MTEERERALERDVAEIRTDVAVLVERSKSWASFTARLIALEERERERDARLNRAIGAAILAAFLIPLLLQVILP